MRKISNLLTALVFVSLIIFVNCGSDNGGSDPVDPLEVQAALLQNNWRVNASEITFDNGNPDGDWSAMTLTISNASAAGGTLSTEGVPTEFGAVWATQDSWTFNNNDEDEMLRASDNVVMTIANVSATTLRLTFTVTAGPSRTAGINGRWSFTFTANQ